MINYTFEALKNINTCHTFTEICQQPTVWGTVSKNLLELRKDFQKTTEKLLSEKNARIILVGAGSSAFVGECLAPGLTQKLGRVVEAIATTDIVSNPEQYLIKNIPTILVSFARSGNSPESVATVDLADQVLENVFHVIITCNKDGKLARRFEKADNALVVLMPDETNDKGFAMTSSYSSMLLSVKLLFDNSIQDKDIETLCKEISEVSAEVYEITKIFKEKMFKRMIVLGSGGIAGMARECSLKMLELTCGAVMTNFETSLGFRHGPKSVVDKDTLVISMVSQDEYTKKYDLDMIKEMLQDTKGSTVIALFPNKEASDEIKNDNVTRYILNNSLVSDDTIIALAYLPIMQLLALETSAQIGLTPDNPSPDGFVNRVVQGVTIHKYK